MKRFALLLVIVVLASALSLTGCQKKVTVETGERVVCTYGDVISDTVTTIEVPADQASAYSVTESAVLCERHERVLKLYAEAQAALTAGDTKAAQAKLEKVVAEDPKFEQAATQLEQIAAGKKPKPDTSVAGGSSGSGSASKPGGSTSAPEKQPQPVGPVVSLQKWVPPTLDGYTSGPVGPDVLAITRQYSATSGPVEAVVISAEQFSSKSTAANGLASLMATYPADRSKEKIAGRQSVLGTGAQEFAAVGFTDGSIAVVIEAHVKPGQSPKKAYDAIREIAASLPTK